MSTDQDNLASEEGLALRVTAERKRRGMSQEQLAKAVEAVLGVSFPQSAVSKIERQQARRAITVDEALAFSRVFGIPLEQLMLPAELAAEQRAVDALKTATRDYWAAVRSYQRCAESIDGLGEVLLEHPPIGQELQEMYRDDAAGRGGNPNRPMLRVLFGETAPVIEPERTFVGAVRRLRRQTGLTAPLVEGNPDQVFSDSTEGDEYFVILDPFGADDVVGTVAVAASAEVS